MINAAELLAAHVRTEGGAKITPQVAVQAAPAVEYARAPVAAGSPPIGDRPPATQRSTR